MVWCSAVAQSTPRLSVNDLLGFVPAELDGRCWKSSCVQFLRHTVFGTFIFFLNMYGYQHIFVIGPIETRHCQIWSEGHSLIMLKFRVHLIIVNGLIPSFLLKTEQYRDMAKKIHSTTDGAGRGKDQIWRQTCNTFSLKNDKLSLLGNTEQNVGDQPVETVEHNIK